MKKLFSKHNIKISIVLCALCFFCSGCELVNIIKKAIRDVYGSPQSISILVYPPFPTKQETDTTEIRKSFSFAEGVKRGLSSGIDEFNEASGSTKVIPIWWTDSDSVIVFYDEVFQNLDKGNELRAICRDKIIALRENTKFTDASCVIFGFFDYNSNATSLKIQLCYYDYSKNLIAFQIGVVDKSDSRAREADLQNLMKTLLKKVYD